MSWMGLITDCFDKVHAPVKKKDVTFLWPSDNISPQLWGWSCNPYLHITPPHLSLQTAYSQIHIHVLTPELCTPHRGSGSIFPPRRVALFFHVFDSGGQKSLCLVRFLKSMSFDSACQKLWFIDLHARDNQREREIGTALRTSPLVLDDVKHCVISLNVAAMLNIHCKKTQHMD